MKRKITLMAMLTLVSTAAWSGLYQPAIVDVNLDTQFASGDMLSAANDNQNKGIFIGCGTRNFDDGAGGIFSFGFCQAEDADGERAICQTQNPALVEAIRAISDGSYIQYSWTVLSDGALQCQSIGISTQSFYVDKAKPSTEAETDDE